MIGVALLLFPKLALGLSGFETGVAVMPLVKGDPTDDPRPSRRPDSQHEEAPADRGAHHERPADWQQSRDDAADSCRGVQGRSSPRPAARSRTWRTRISVETFGTIYDLSTISILWFAGASAMAGLLTLVPRYLPRYGMAPEWAKATRPLVVLFAGITISDHVSLRRERRRTGRRVRDGRSRAHDLGRRRGHAAFPADARPFRPRSPPSRSSSSTRRSLNIYERPEGIKIASWFIATIIVTSMVSRVLRSTELRVQSVAADPIAQGFITSAG